MLIEVSLEALQGVRSVCGEVKDPRTPINIVHPAVNIIAISIAAIIAGAEGPSVEGRQSRWEDGRRAPRLARGGVWQGD